MTDPESSNRLVHASPARMGTSDWLLLAGAAFALIFGVITLDLFVLLFAALLHAFFALVTHRRYELYDDRLVISYWLPRRRTVARAAIASAQRVKLPLKPESAFLERSNGRPLIVTPADLDGFLAQVTRSPRQRDQKQSDAGPPDAPRAQSRRRRPRRRRS